MTVPSPDQAPFVGRDAERALLRAALDDARRGHGRTVLVGGEPGIGKSRLVEQLTSDAAAAGVATHLGQCDAMDGAPDLWPWRQVLRTLAAGEPMTSPSPLDPADVAEATRFQQADAVVGWLTERTRTSPTVLVFEDVHWADRGSLELLEFLAAHVARLPLLVVATHRLEAVVPGRPLYAALAEITRGAVHPPGDAARLHARGRARVRRRGQRPRAVGRRASTPLVRHTGGNPVLPRRDHAMARSSSAASTSSQADAVDALPAPPTVRDVVAHRVAQLPAERRGDARARGRRRRGLHVAAARQRARRPIPPSCSGTSTPPLAAGLVVESAPGGYRFAHAVVRDVVYAGLPSAKRLGHHRDLARFFEERDDRDEHLRRDRPPHARGRAARSRRRRRRRRPARGAPRQDARRLGRERAALAAGAGGVRARCAKKDPRQRAELLSGSPPPASAPAMRARRRSPSSRPPTRRDRSAIATSWSARRSATACGSGPPTPPSRPACSRCWRKPPARWATPCRRTRRAS